MLQVFEPRKQRNSFIILEELKGHDGKVLQGIYDPDF